MNAIDDTVFITGEPIETAIGNIRFFTVKEYHKISQDLNTMSMTKDHILNLLNREKKNPEIKEFVQYVEQIPLYDIVREIHDIWSAYERIFKACLPHDAIDKINAGTFPKIRSLILKMNCIKEEKINPNPEIQRALERSRRVKSREGENIEFADLVSSVAMGSGIPYREINEFTIYQLYMSFHRIHQFKNYDTNIVFATVAPSKGKIESWSKHINLFEEENHSIAYDQFKKTTGNMLND